ncbi:MAG: hypothetical protein PWP48_1399 [Clostridiales bacterium]|nr:hypothetical protein [Clostridiales bacterium]MDK2992166.1 hypothetical protein [Clostridiales bacterium]
MHNLKEIMLCSKINFKKWIITPRMYAILAIIIIFGYYTFSDIPKIAAYLEVNATPWVFPFFMTHPTMFIIFGSLTTMLYCNAPFEDGHMPFLVIRIGRYDWIIGQVLYIYLSSFVYTSCFFLISILMLLPRIEFTTDWGQLLYAISKSPSEIMEQTGAALNFMPYEELLDILTPIQATILSFTMFWLVTAFIGVLICCFNILIGEMVGIIAAGIFTGIAYFSAFLGTISLGKWIYYLSPISWSSISYLDWHGTGSIPSPTYAIICLLIAIALLSIVSVVVFCKRDLEIYKGEF